FQSGKINREKCSAIPRTGDGAREAFSGSEIMDYILRKNDHPSRRARLTRPRAILGTTSLYSAPDAGYSIQQHTETFTFQIIDRATQITGVCRDAVVDRAPNASMVQTILLQPSRYIAAPAHRGLLAQRSRLVKVRSAALLQL